MKREEFRQKLDTKARAILVEFRALLARIESAQFSFHGSETLAKMSVSDLSEVSRTLTDLGAAKNGVKALTEEFERLFSGVES